MYLSQASTEMLATIPRRYKLSSLCFVYKNTFGDYWKSVAEYFLVTHFMMTQTNGNFSALLVICGGNSPVRVEFPAQRQVTRCSDVFFDLRLNKRLSKQSWGCWFETPSLPIFRRCNAILLTGHITATKCFPVNHVCHVRPGTRSWSIHNGSCALRLV